MKRTIFGIAAAVAVGVLSAEASAVTLFGNVSNKGSLLIYSRIDVGDGNDTLITLTNDNAAAVRLKCFYATSDPLPTPYARTAIEARGLKHFTDFTIDVTHNQPISWWASTGLVYSPSAAAAGLLAPPFGVYPDGSIRTVGELKCWAITPDGRAELHWNHLFGTASVLNPTDQQAYEYTASAFQAVGNSTLTGTVLGTPGVINLDNIEYDSCPNILVGNFIPISLPLPPPPDEEQVEPDVAPAPTDPRTRVTLASCNQDLRQAYTPTITKLTWTFWNQDEQARTGTHACADSWFETSFPVETWPLASAPFLGTAAAYFRIETTADTQVCGPSATTSAYTGVISQSIGGGFTRGTNLVGRGVAPGAVKYDLEPLDSFKK